MMANEKTAGSKPVQNVIKVASAITGLLGGKSQKPAARVQRTKLLISVVNRRDELRLKEILDDCSATLSLLFAATGTARSQVLDYLGIGETEKSVLCSLFPEFDEEHIMRELRTKMSLYLVGRGISFTVPLSGVSEIVSDGLTKAAANQSAEGKKFMTNEERKFDLVVAAVNANSVDDAMEATRAAGAAGGTILRSRTLPNAKAEQFIGISLAREQEVLLILCKRENKRAIMEALSEKVGLKTEAGGVIFSLPVDKTAGISATEEETNSEQKEEKNE